MPRMRWRPGLRPGPRWGSSQAHSAPPDTLVGWRGPPQEPHASRRLDPRAFSARCSAPRF